ncbi:MULTISPECIES: FG-GAP-like repeat-containing protein [Niastella]|uniref:VCBS repeat-containing protein n=1 Tax=Niastella soli TaxID=2821487 RepID=A0ABS3YLA4_9BACT|nr:FG-GAP-like repeat-containing protein [Niastella soli]MBO9198676.1 VCBS repeat-containing protein [Niastella soli]
MKVNLPVNISHQRFSQRYWYLVFFLLLAQMAALTTQAQMRQLYIDADNANAIKKISFYSPTQGYVAFNKWVGYTTDSGRTFVKKYITNGNVNFNGFTNVNILFGFGITGVKAFDANNLIVYGHFGYVPAILQSSDQGNTFTLIYLSYLNAKKFTDGTMDMVFPTNSVTGYAVEADRIVKTINRGYSWFSVYESANSFFDFVEAVDDNTVFAFSTDYNGNKLLKTTNGGSSWVRITIPQGQVKYASFVSASNGWLRMIDISGNWLLYYTSNGGLTWTLKNDLMPASYFTAKMKFINDSTGYSVSPNSVIYKTTDSGRVWEPLPQDNASEYYHNDLHFWDKDQFWAGGEHGLLEISTNGGGTPLPRAYFKVDTVEEWKTRIVNLHNFSKSGYQYKWYVNDVLISTSYNTSYTHDLTSQLDSVKLVVTHGGLSDSITQYQLFFVPVFPSITSFTPITGSTGTLITIYGNNFANLSDVQFGGTSATSFTIVSPNKITAVVGAGATGNISLVHLYGTFSAPGFTYFAPPASPPPVITSFSPEAGPVGTTVTISGSNFDAVPANNVIYFGDTRATISSASTNQLTCIVPMGASHKPIFVLNTTTHLSGESFKPFITTFAESVEYFTGKSFTQAYASYYPYLPGIKSATSVDVDNDGKTDIIAAYSVNNYDTIIVHRNTTSLGGFSFEDRYTVGPLMSILAETMVHTADMDGDGLPDILGATNTDQITIYRNASVPGNISFAGPLQIPANAGIQDVKASDLDGDGKPDLVAIGITGKSAVSVIRNTSSPGYLSFAPVINYPVNLGTNVAIGDIDNDGKSDIVAFTAVNSNYTITLFKNTSTPGSISFAAGVDIISGGNGYGSVILADMDKDNKLDVVLNVDNKYKIGRNISASGSIAFDFTYSGTALAGNAVVESFSGDSKPDFISGLFDAYVNTAVPGTITQTGPVSFGGTVLCAGDFNNDGKQDVVISGRKDQTAMLIVLKNGVGVPVDFSVCAGSATIDADVNGSGFQWQQDDGSGFVDINDNNNFLGSRTRQLKLSNVPAGWTGYKYRCVTGGNIYSSVFKILNKTLPQPDVSIKATATTICYGNSVTFSASDNSGRIVTQYRWQINGNDWYTYTPLFTSSVDLRNNCQVRLIATFRDDCWNTITDTSNVITMTVNGEPSAVTISTPATVVCAGSPASFTAVPVNGGSNPTYQWQVNGVNTGTNSPVFIATSLVNNSQVRVVMTPFTTCPSPYISTSNSINITVQSAMPAVSISVPSNVICPGANLFFTATPTNTGKTATYQWKRNGQNVGTNIQYYADNTLVNGDVISVELTTDYACTGNNVVVSSAALPIQVLAAQTPSIAISGNTVVNKGQATTLHATAINAGSLPDYRWEDSTQAHTWLFVSSTPDLQYTPVATGDKVRCKVVSSAVCPTAGNYYSVPLTFTVNIPTAIAPEPVAGQFHIYPNPVTTLLTLDSLKLSDTWTTLEITTVSGSRVLTQAVSGKTRVDVWVERLSKGMYIALLRKKNGEAFYYKFLKM